MLPGMVSYETCPYAKFTWCFWGLCMFQIVLVHGFKAHNRCLVFTFIRYIATKQIMLNQKLVTRCGLRTPSIFSWNPRSTACDMKALCAASSFGLALKTIISGTYCYVSFSPALSLLSESFALFVCHTTLKYCFFHDECLQKYCLKSHNTNSILLQP